MPSMSLERFLKKTNSMSVGSVGFHVKSAIGGILVTVIALVMFELAPSSSITVSVT